VPVARLGGLLQAKNHALLVDAEPYGAGCKRAILPPAAGANVLAPMTVPLISPLLTVANRAPAKTGQPRQSQSRLAVEGRSIFGRIFCSRARVIWKLPCCRRSRRHPPRSWDERLAGREKLVRVSSLETECLDNNRRTVSTPDWRRVSHRKNEGPSEFDWSLMTPYAW
jgi:hypothetical protein